MKVDYYLERRVASASVYPSKYSTFIKLFWLILALAIAWTFGLALKLVYIQAGYEEKYAQTYATPKPEADIMARSFAPSPTAMT